MLHVKPFHIRGFLPLPYEEALAPRVRRAHERLQSAASDWVCLPDGGLLTRITSAAAGIRRDSRALVMIGTACLGVRGIIECLSASGRGDPALYFIGGLSGDEIRETLDAVAGTDFSVIAGGGDAGAGAALRFFRAALEERYGREEARGRIYGSRESPDIPPENVFPPPEGAGERYTLLTTAGLLPMAAAGVDISALLRGAAGMMESCAAGGYACPAWQYAALRYELYRTGRPVEVLACCDPAFRFLLEWRRQLEDGRRGLLSVVGGFAVPAADRDTDKPLLFETILHPGASRCAMTVPAGADGPDFLAGESMDYIRDRALEGALLAHTKGGIPSIVLEAGGKTPETLGELVYFLQYACGLSGYLLDTNSLGQPGLEAYQSDVLALLGKPDCAGRRAVLEEKLQGGAALWTV